MFDDTKDKLFVISAPSAGGKTTIIMRLISLLDGSLHRIITCTTRKMREGEVQGVDYKFLSKDEFSNLLKEDAFIEYATVYGNEYGVLREDVWCAGNKIISVDSKGVENFKKRKVAAVYILIAPPSLEVLQERLLKRGTETASDLQVRMDEAKKELESEHLFDHVIINDNLEDAVDACKTIIIGEIENEKTK